MLHKQFIGQHSVKKVQKHYLTMLTLTSLALCISFSFSIARTFSAQKKINITKTSLSRPMQSHHKRAVKVKGSGPDKVYTAIKMHLREERKDGVYLYPGRWFWPVPHWESQHSPLTVSSSVRCFADTLSGTWSLPRTVDKNKKYLRIFVMKNMWGSQ